MLLRVQCALLLALGRVTRARATITARAGTTVRATLLRHAMPDRDLGDPTNTKPCHDRRPIVATWDKESLSRQRILYRDKLLCRVRMPTMCTRRCARPGLFVCVPGCHVRTSPVATQGVMSRHGNRNLCCDRILEMGSSPPFSILCTSKISPMFFIHYYCLYTIYTDSITRETMFIIHCTSSKLSF